MTDKEYTRQERLQAHIDAVNAAHVRHQPTVADIALLNDEYSAWFHAWRVGDMERCERLTHTIEAMEKCFGIIEVES